MTKKTLCHFSLMDDSENFFSAKLDGSQLSVNLDFNEIDQCRLIPADGPMILEVRVAGLGTAEFFNFPTAADLNEAIVDLDGLDGYQHRDLELRVIKCDPNGAIECQWWHPLSRGTIGYLPDDMRGVTSESLLPWEIELSWEERLCISMGKSLAEAVESGNQAARNLMIDRVLIDIHDEVASGDAMDRIQARLSRANLWPPTDMPLNRWLNEAHKELMQ